ncbi:hypothetical protein WJX81_005741 [Elliptochloris bilobata]|uniref:Reticulon-like protein n=1 Tax=Elliptochloris bilobata TaxID=381761 RepID=A0AAW1R1K5_9CHLO
MSSQKRISLPVGNQHVEDLLLWRDPKKSGAVFVGITLLYILLQWTGLSLLTIVANSLLILVSCSFLWNNVASFAGRPGVWVPETFRSGVSESQVKSYAEMATIYLNKALGFMNRVITGKEVVLSGQVALALFVVGKVGAWFTSLGLLYIVVLLACTIPKAYELRKDEIDRAFNKAHHHGKENYNKYVEPYLNKIPRASTSTSTTPGKHSALDSTAESTPLAPNSTKKAL